ncbi:MAG: DUF2238 domain-containing protein [bacterium]
MPAALLAAFLALWTWAAISPLYRFDWFLENILVFLTVPALVVTYRWFRFSATSYVLLFVFVSMHVLGSHWTYNHVPHFYWGPAGAHANVYDRLVHAGYGLLLTYPAAELFRRAQWATGPRAGVLALQFIVATSALYEILEWATAVVVDPNAADAFLGQQGDAFDSVEDMALAAAGSAVMLLGWGAWTVAAGRSKAAKAP